MSLKRQLRAALAGCGPAQGHPLEGGRPDEVPAAREGTICCGQCPREISVLGVLSRSQSL